MQKHAFIRALAKKNRRPQAFYQTALTEIFDGLKEQLAQGKTIQFIGFGTFLTRTHKGGKGMHFTTKKPIEYKGYRLPAFKAGSRLKQAIRRKKGLFGK